MLFNQIPEKQGLYDPAFEHDSCGVAFVADLHGRPSRQMVLDALEVLSRMNHRGASGADPDTGDGAGILIQIPHQFMQEEAAKLKITLGEAGTYGIAQVFLPQEGPLSQQCKARFEAACLESGLKSLGWREVPVRPDLVGLQARESMPRMEMLFITSGDGAKLEQKELETRLYLARKRAEHAVIQLDGLSMGQFYVASCSSRSIVYKGMLTSPQLGQFFLDLQDPRVCSGLALVHSRFSTNTFPSWDRAQPFRYLAHNGEINTLKGNETWMRSREASLSENPWGIDPELLCPVVQEGGSDSQALDNVLELVYQGGRDLTHSMSLLVPAAWEGNALLSEELRDFYRYQRCISEAWDGPAALAYTDGVCIAASLDRNGLRPGRWLLTTDERVLMASELGVLDIPASKILRSGRLEPGKTLFVDTAKGALVSDAGIKKELSSRAPYGQWLAEGLETLQTKKAEAVPATDWTLLRSLGYNREETEMIIAVMARNGQEPIGSMGNDAPHAVLSGKKAPLFSYFRQLFAQVTNPPIDPLREGCVMSLETVVGPTAPFLSEGPEHARRLVLTQPVLSEESLAELQKLKAASLTKLSLLFAVAEGEAGFTKALDALCLAAEKGVREGRGYILLSDRGIDAEHAAIPSLVALGAVHQHLARQKIRSQAAIIADSAEPREVHHFCVLFGYGADAVVPWGAYQVLAHQTAGDEVKLRYSEAVENYIHAIEYGLKKVLSKMGISTLMSYKGAQIFEAVGIGEAMVARCFTGTPSRVGGIDLEDSARTVLDWHKAAYGREYEIPHLLESGGFYRWRRDGELHAWSPEAVAAIQDAVRSGNYDLYKRYVQVMDAPVYKGDAAGAITLRQLLRFKETQGIPLDEVESEASILRRFATGAMSFGSISAQAHETLARAMNRLGGMSNTGEGGEAPWRFVPQPDGDSLCSKVKQVASGRFGVTTLYLANAEEIQIKMAQGAKPGEGGQLPGHKVSDIIAKTRYTTEGVTLISPPPHHDIYSIEDLAQLILDLKNVNPTARITVKLVSEMGVGTVAAGVAKAQAEMILISGSDGGTGASPLSSIKHAGLPWELGLSETHQTLVLNGLRDRVRLQCDGGMRTGRDLAIACLLGADEFGFAAGALIAMGCTMLRHCHLNNCSMGVATQDDRCAARFGGKTEHVENYMRFTARYLREIMAQLGFRSLDEMRGHSELLEAAPGLKDHAAKLDFSRILYKPTVSPALADLPESPRADLRQKLDLQLIELSKPAVDKGRICRIELPISNTDRSAGAMLSGHIMKARGESALPPETILCEFTGTAGQSFGAWLCKGVRMRLRGFANDYVGKGLFGGVLAIAPAEDSVLEAGSDVLVGNTSLYGAIRGELYVAGRAGERFCVRNSGATAVAEGVGDHACEYMTGGIALILGPTGRNFAAGMSGGIAYVLDEDGSFESRFNSEFADLEELNDKDIFRIRSLLRRHYDLTNSPRAKAILDKFAEKSAQIRKVMPRDYRRYLMSRGEL